MYELIISKFRFRYFWSMLCNISGLSVTVLKPITNVIWIQIHAIKSQRLPILLMHGQHITNTYHSAANIRILNQLRITNDFKMTVKKLGFVNSPVRRNSWFYYGHSIAQHHWRTHSHWFWYRIQIVATLNMRRGK